MKLNPTPLFVALLASTFVSLILVVILLFIDVQWTTVLVTGVLCFLLSGLFYYFLLQLFIQRKIQQIYKNIYRFKAQDKKLLKSLNSPKSDPIQEVSDEVLNWMQDNKKEILQLREQAKFRREFIGDVSHELKTPIFSVQGYIHTLLEGALEDPTVNRKFLRKAAKGVDRLAELVEDLTSISEIQAGQLKLNRLDFDLVHLVQDVFEWTDKLAREHGVELEFTKSNLRSTMVNADRKRMGQVLTNLLVNAIKYGKDGGRVTVHCFPFEKKVMVQVKDEGEGISDEHIKRLFDRFYRVDSHRNREEGGTGLGLSIVKHILEAHNQNITVESKADVGSTFSFTLDRA